MLEGLTELCRDPNNVVFVVSGRGKDELQHAFGHIQVNSAVYGAHTRTISFNCSVIQQVGCCWQL